MLLLLGLAALLPTLRPVPRLSIPVPLLAVSTLSVWRLLRLTTPRCSLRLVPQPAMPVSPLAVLSTMTLRRRRLAALSPLLRPVPQAALLAPGPASVACPARAPGLAGLRALLDLWALLALRVLLVPRVVLALRALLAKRALLAPQAVLARRVRVVALSPGGPRRAHANLGWLLRAQVCSSELKGVLVSSGELWRILACAGMRPRRLSAGVAALGGQLPAMRCSLWELCSALPPPGLCCRRRVSFPAMSSTGSALASSTAGSAPMSSTSSAMAGSTGSSVPMSSASSTPASYTASFALLSYTVSSLAGPAVRSALGRP